MGFDLMLSTTISLGEQLGKMLRGSMFPGSKKSTISQNVLVRGEILVTDEELIGSFAQGHQVLHVCSPAAEDIGLGGPADEVRDLGFLLNRLALL